MELRYPSDPEAETEATAVMTSPAAAPVAATEETQVPGALLRNVTTVVLLIGLPVIGLVAVWTLATWNRKAKIIVTAIFALPTSYYLFIVYSALLRAAF